MPRHFALYTRLIAGIGAAICCCSLAGISAQLHAQDRPASRTIPAKSTDEKSTVQRAASELTPNRVASDTGRMTWGRQDYSMYTSAFSCDRAIIHMRAEVMRTRIYDTIPYSLEADTLPTSARTLANICGTRFAPEGTPPHELWSLLRIAMAMGDDTRMNAAIERTLSVATTRHDSAERFVTAIELLFGGSPPRLATAQSLLKRLDALGDAARVEQYLARTTMLGYWKTVYNRDSLRTYSMTAIERLHAMTPDERDLIDNRVFSPYMMLNELANEAQDLKEQDRLFNQALTDLGAWREGAASRWLTASTALLETRKNLYGRRTKPLDGAFWFNTGGTPRPALGKLSLLVKTDHTCGEKCFPLYTLIRQLKREFGDEIDITLITETRGYARGTGPIPPAEEAKKAAFYFLDFLKLPVGVLVDEVPFTKETDGRIRWLTSPIGEMFAGWQGANAVLVDQSSTIRWIGGIGGSRDKLLIDAAIRHVMAKASSAANKTAEPTP